MCKKAHKISPDFVGAYFIIGIIEVKISNAERAYIDKVNQSYRLWVALKKS